ncbi:hypothetical protein [Microbacterium capsulatum]|uniref:Uncharacterized protein n=1 Tax=Microbacterium capsulatum TaxID=3041921 RepID=A0ABU0XF25_9MICO|nr:hypothetical protein [Microbacterium sp. ASV81]MDQ4213228.1 hypothetical protein [Microbacterium sp. ASV81]
MDRRSPAASSLNDPVISKGREIPPHLAHIAESANLGFAQAV